VLEVVWPELDEVVSTAPVPLELVAPPAPAAPELVEDAGLPELEDAE
jgi:hypothetical protein